MPDGAGAKRSSTGLAVAALALCAAAFGAGRLTSDLNEAREGTSMTRHDTAESYAHLAGLLASRLARPGEVVERPSLAELEVWARRYEQELREVATHTAELARFADAQLGVVATGRDLQAEAPNAWDFIAGVLYVGLGVATQYHPLIGEGGKRAIGGVTDTGAFLTRIKMAQVQAQANAIEFATTASAQFSGPVTADRLVSFTFVPRKDGFLGFGETAPDSVVLTNVSGRQLDDCVVVVRLRGEGGETFANVHYVRSWAAGEKRVGRYDDGLFGCTVDDPDRVTVLFWSRQASSPALSIERDQSGW